MNTNKKIIYGTLALFIVFTFIAVILSKWKVLGISWIAFVAMAAAVPLGAKTAEKTKLTSLIASYGLASGAMITAAAIFLIPEAIHYDAVYGGIGIALGIFIGFATHTFNHGLSHTSLPADPVLIELTTHSITDGIIIGLVYAAMPQLGLLLGAAIVAHKAPAGYAAAKRLSLQNNAASLVLVPSCAMGLAAIPVSLLHIPELAVLNALVFGIATGVFFHVAMDFLPECEVGGNIHRQSNLDSHAHHQLDQYRNWAVLNIFAGGIIIFLLWYLIH